MALRSSPTRATQFLWRAAGSPPPTETDGTPIRSREADRHCAACGAPAAFRLRDAISDNFSTVKNASRAWPFGGDGVCAACLWCCKTVALRCAMFFAREDGFWWVPTWALKGMPSTRPNPLEALLNPPEPPFVACYPRTGIEHGGEDALDRCVLAAPELTDTLSDVRQTMNDAADRLLRSVPPDVRAEDAKKLARRALIALTPPWPSDVDFADLRDRFSSFVREPWWRWATWPLIKLQSKHTALYAVVSTSRERYHLQIDDTSDVVVDVPVWTAARDVCAPLVAELRAAGVGSRDVEAALLTLRAPVGAPIGLLAAWRKRTAPLLPNLGAKWWPVFVSLLPMPALTKGTEL